MTTEPEVDEVEGQGPHEDPHFKNGACDCVCDVCMDVIYKDKYVCICPQCNGKCDSTHEVG